jgi:hypothetical protein
VDFYPFWILTHPLCDRKIIGGYCSNEPTFLALNRRRRLTRIYVVVFINGIPVNLSKVEVKTEKY